MAVSPSTPVATPSGRLAGALLVCLMAVGSFALWTVVPLGCLWVSSKVAGSSVEEYVLALPMTILAMILFGIRSRGGEKPLGAGRRRAQRAETPDERGPPGHAAFQLRALLLARCVRKRRVPPAGAKPLVGGAHRGGDDGPPRRGGDARPGPADARPALVGNGQARGARPRARARGAD